MTSCVFDASAIVALLEQERGWEVIRERLDGGVASTVNISEAIHILVKRGADFQHAADSIRRLRLSQIAFDEEQAVFTAFLHARTRQKGLSLGDRACLALAMIRNCVALTSDSNWEGLDVGVTIKLFR